MKELIYEYHIFEPQKYELDGEKIIAVIHTTFAVVKRKPEKNQACTCICMAGMSHHPEQGQVTFQFDIKSVILPLQGRFV